MNPAAASATPPADQERHRIGNQGNHTTEPRRHSVFQRGQLPRVSDCRGAGECPGLAYWPPLREYEQRVFFNPAIEVRKYQQNVAKSKGLRVNRRFMIISHHLRCIFVAVPKTASQSIRLALRSQLGPQDEEQTGWHTRSTLKNKPLAKLRTGHLTAQQTQQALPAIWQSYYKFAFVRNPWDRYVSFCHFRFKDDPEFKRNPTLLMKAYIQGNIHQRSLWAKPQIDFLADEDGALMVDFVGRYENLQHDLNKILQRLGLRSVALTHMNKSRHDDFRSYYDNELRDMVIKKYHKDICCFGYSFEKHPVAS